MSDAPILQGLTEFVAGVRAVPPPPEVIADASRRVRDVIGNSLAALDTDAARIASQLAGEMSGTEEATAFSGGSMPAASAALVNGTLAHALDFDDTHLPSILHPSASVVPAALSVAERLDRSGATLTEAVAIGDEIAIRLGMAGFDPELGNSIFFERGLHATSICGTIGAAAAAAYLMGLDAAGVGHAIGVAASMGAGLLEANRTGGSVKTLHCGWAAHAGVMAADLARLGLTGPPTVIEGRFGFLQAYLGERADAGSVLSRLGHEWTVTTTFFKPYPSNHFTHAVIDCALQLRELVQPHEIERVEVGVPGPVMRTIAEPLEQKARPATGYAAKFSGPYTFAAALLGGGGLGVYLDDFTDAAAADPRRLELASRVQLMADDECSAIYPHQFPAVARVALQGGEARQVKVLVNRGGPQNPLSDDELRMKFLMNAGRGLAADRLAPLDTALAVLPEIDSVRRLVSLCTMDGD